MIDYSSPREEVIKALYTLGINVKGTACRCPSPYHEDQQASASILDKGHCRVYCHVCDKSWDLTDLVGRAGGKEYPKEPPQTREQVNAWLKQLGTDHQIFTYADLKGSPVLHEVRFLRKQDGKKDYRPFYPVDGGYRIGKSFTPWILYNLGNISKAETVVVCEGPKSADAVNELCAIPATTGPFGAGKSDSVDWEPLIGKKVILWADNDEIGMDHMKSIGVKLLDIGCSVATLDVSKMPSKGDAADIDLSARLEMLDTAVFKSGVDLYFDRNERIISGELAPPPTPWPFFTKIHQAWNPDTVTLLYGAGGTRKTYFLIHLMRHLMDHNKKPALLGLEMSESDYIDRIMAQKLDLPGFVNMRWKSENPDIVRKSQIGNRDYINQFLSLLSLPGEALMTCDDAIAWAYGLPDDIDMIILDPVSYLDVKEPWNEHKKLAHSLKKLATERQIPIILSNHTTKDGQLMAGGDSLNKHTDATYLFHANKKPEELMTCKGLSVGRQQYTIHNVIEIIKGRYSENPYNSFAFECLHNLEFKERGMICDD